MLISSQSVAAPSFVVPLALGHWECPVATMHISYGMCLFGDETEEVDIDSVFELSDMIAGIVADCLEDGDEDQGLWDVDLYLYEYCKMLEGHLVEMTILKTGEVAVYIDEECDRIDIEPRAGARIIRILKKEFIFFVKNNPGMTLFALPHEADGEVEDRNRFFKKLGFIPDPYNNGLSLMLHT